MFPLCLGRVIPGPLGLMKESQMTFRVLIIFVLFFVLFSCTTNQFLHTFDNEPIVSSKYFPDKNETQYATSSMTIHTDKIDGIYCHILMQGILLAEGKPLESKHAYRAVLRFRSLNVNQRFESDRNLTFLIGDKNYNLGEFQMTAVHRKNKWIAEDFLIDVNENMLITMAKADTVYGKVGMVDLAIPKLYLLPLSSLVDTTTIIE